MAELRYTLLADGSSDRALLPILTWALQQQGVTYAIQSTWADLGRLPRRPRTFVERIDTTLRLYPCDLLCIHRDAEREPHAVRHSEIVRALDELARQQQLLPVAVCVVPVRMLEAWLLFDETAIRMASGNPRGRQDLQLPRLADIERSPDPEEILRQLMRTASGLSGRRLQRLEVNPLRVAELIDDFSPLRALSAFQAFEQELEQVVMTQGWGDIAGDPG
ncbi:MAG TPA: hypothetical protein VGJ87_00335 [Roseiflexaceae bacterium]|jgi:hypothetical protein